MQIFLQFRHCEWVPELMLEIHHPIPFLPKYWRKMDPNVPPWVDDSFDENALGKIGLEWKREEEKDPHNLEKKFYRYGLKPEWLQVCSEF